MKYIYVIISEQYMPNVNYSHHAASLSLRLQVSKRQERRCLQ